MSNYTEHYNLKKPLKTESYDVDVANTNNDIIDEKLYSKVDKVAGKGLSSNDFTDGYKQKIDKLIEGTKGDSAYQVAVNNGFDGTEEAWLSSLKGDKGDTGEVSQEGLKKATENKRLRIEGKSEQAVRSGKNKLKITNFTDITTDGVTFTAKFSNNKELEYIEAKGNSTTGYNPILSINISDLPAGDYIINGLGTNKVIRYVLLKNNDTEPKIITNDGDIRFTQDSSSPYIRFRIDLYMAGEINTKTRPMIRQASITDNTYEPYRVSPSPDYPSRIRNIGDNINLAKYVKNLWINTSTLKFINIENVNGFVAKVKPNTQYIINKKYIGNRFIIFSSSAYPQINTDVVRSIYASNHNLTQYIFSTQANEKYIFLGVYVGNDEEELKKAIEEVKIEEGSTATPYTEYDCGSIDYKVENVDKTESKTIHFPLSKGQLLHEEDYIDSDGIHKNRKTIILDGTENWNLGTNGNSLTYFFTNAGFVSAKNQNLLCNSLTPITNLWNETENKDLICIRFQLDLINIMLADTTINTIEKLKSWLAEQYENNTPIVVEYQLAEEIVTPLTKEQIEAFYELQKAKYVDKMELTCLDEIEPTLVDIEKSLEESLLDVEKLLAMLSLNS